MSTDTWVHDSNAMLDYVVDWSAWLAMAETITALDVAVESGDVVIGPVWHSNTLTVSWVSGGTVRTRAEVRHRITTNQGRTDDRTVVLLVNDR